MLQYAVNSICNALMSGQGPSDAANQHGHGYTVLCLPVTHCELNPIELAWASVKGYIVNHNKTFILKEIQQLTPDGITHTTDMWRAFCKHVIDFENNYIVKY